MALDVAVTIDTGSSSTSVIEVFLGNGNGTFRRQQRILKSGSMSIAVADFNWTATLIWCSLQSSGQHVSVMPRKRGRHVPDAVSYTVGPVSIGYYRRFESDGHPRYRGSGSNNYISTAW